MNRNKDRLIRFI